VLQEHPLGGTLEPKKRGSGAAALGKKKAAAWKKKTQQLLSIFLLKNNLKTTSSSSLNNHENQLKLQPLKHPKTQQGLAKSEHKIHPKTTSKHAPKTS